MLKEFRDFIARGNVLDLAVGIVVGAAFTAIVNSFVKDILSPIIGLLGTANFDDQVLVLKSGNPPVTLNYGAFLTAVINFLIVAFAVFLVVKAANHVKSKVVKPAEEEKKEPEPTKEELLLTEIRDLLKR